MPVRRLFFSLIFIFAAFIFPFNTFAKTPAASISASPAVYSNLPPTISTTSPLYTDLLVHNLFHTFSCLTVGQSSIGQPCLTYQITQNAQGMIQSVPMLSQTHISGGALGGLTSVIGLLYENPPVRTADYLASIGGMGVVKNANAQVVGSGERVLNPIVRLWQVSRNVAYLLMIIIFMVIGLMIMFRNKINPQTVISAQAALPGLVIGLIMITFSFFFAGLLSDMAFIGTNIVGYYFSAVRGESGTPQNLVQDVSKENVFSLMGPFTGILGGKVGADTGILDTPPLEGILYSFWSELPSGLFSPQFYLTMLATFMSAQMVGGATEGLKAIKGYGEGIQAVLQLITAGTTAINPTFVLSFFLGFIVVIMLLFALFKLALKLITAYLTIIFLTISAPFQFLAASLPGRGGMVTGWVKSMLGNILAFPAVLAVLYFVVFLVDADFVNNMNKNQFHCGDKNKGEPDCIFQISQNNPAGGAVAGTVYAQSNITLADSTTFPMFGGLKLEYLRYLLALGALMALPTIPDIINKAVGGGSQAGQAIGGEIGAIFGSGQRYGGQFQQGVGQASGQLARLRALSPTPAYRIMKAEGGKYGVYESYDYPGANVGALARSDNPLAKGIRRIFNIGHIPEREKLLREGVLKPTIPKASDRTEKASPATKTEGEKLDA